MPLLNEDGTVTISKDDYEALVRDARFMECLEVAGVDNWDGYEYGVRDFIERYGGDAF